MAPIASPSTPARWVRGGDYGQLEAVLNEMRMLGRFGNLNFGLKSMEMSFLTYVSGSDWGILPV